MEGVVLLTTAGAVRAGVMIIFIHLAMPANAPLPVSVISGIALWGYVITLSGGPVA